MTFPPWLTFSWQPNISSKDCRLKFLAFTSLPSLSFWSRGILARAVAASSPPNTEIRQFGQMYRNRGLHQPHPSITWVRCVRGGIRSPTWPSAVVHSLSNHNQCTCYHIENVRCLQRLHGVWNPSLGGGEGGGYSLIKTLADSNNKHRDCGDDRTEDWISNYLV